MGIAAPATSNGEYNPARILEPINISQVTPCYQVIPVLIANPILDILMAHSDHEHLKISDLIEAVSGYKMLIEHSLK